MEFTPYLQALSAPFAPDVLSRKNKSALRILIVSAHPDDECITGALALRMAKENSARVLNVAVTLGSKQERKKPRLQELKSACKFLKIGLEVLSEDWKIKEKELKIILERYKPHLIIAPHLKDFHPTHIKTAKLLQRALLKSKQPCILAWAEFWNPLQKPNCLLEIPLEILELQMKGLQFHKGEIQRNPYHLRLPAWMMDNVRRGSEIISHMGAEVPTFAFGVLYQIQMFKSKKFTNLKFTHPFISSQHNLDQIFNEILLAASGSRTRVK
jgi:N-acetylglucosamine malate deacetylase 1